MEELKALARDIEKRKLARAREASIEEKLLDGPRLFQMACEAMRAGLRLDHPSASEEDIHRRLIERIYGNL
jgi:dsRNA-specific ribonuclease